MPPRVRGLSEADRALWASYAGQLTPLRGRGGEGRREGEPAGPKAAGPQTALPQTALPQTALPQTALPQTALLQAALPQPQADPLARPKVAAQATKPRKMASPLAVGDHPGGIDSATWQRFRSGKLATERRLDLHGMTAQRAFHTLVSFLRSAHAEQVRCVEVVTGRGSGETGGVIRREFPHWLNLPEIRPLILGAAHPHALNQGSVRLILRRIR